MRRPAQSWLLMAVIMAALPGPALAQDRPAAVQITSNKSTTTAPVPRPVDVRLHADQPLRVENVGHGTPGWLTALISVVPALIALIGSLIVVSRSNRQSEKNSLAAIELASNNAQAAVNQKANELEIARIEHWLGTFFGPFMQLSEENKRIADLLRARQSDPDFRTLKALLDPEWKRSASETDLNLISRIVGNGVQLRTLIREKAGPTAPALSAYLSRAAAHFSILELADAGALTEETGDFDLYVYPRQLDPVLKLERDRLEARRDVLLSGLSERHVAAPALEIPANLALDHGPGAAAPRA